MTTTPATVRPDEPVSRIMRNTVAVVDEGRTAREVATELAAEEIGAVLVESQHGLLGIGAPTRHRPPGRYGRRRRCGPGARPDVLRAGHREPGRPGPGRRRADDRERGAPRAGSRRRPGGRHRLRAGRARGPLRVPGAARGPTGLTRGRRSRGGRRASTAGSRRRGDHDPTCTPRRRTPTSPPISRAAAQKPFVTPGTGSFGTSAGADTTRG